VSEGQNIMAAATDITASKTMPAQGLMKIRKPQTRSLIGSVSLPEVPSNGGDVLGAVLSTRTSTHLDRWRCDFTVGRS